MATKAIRPTNKPRASQKRPTISIRLSRTFIEKLDTVADKLDLPRSDLIARVLTLYLGDRGEITVATLKNMETRHGEAVDLFA